MVQREGQQQNDKANDSHKEAEQPKLKRKEREDSCVGYRKSCVHYRNG